MSTVDAHKCCTKMADALRAGDIYDIERYIHTSVPRRDLRLATDGSDPPPTLRFCPWCAAAIVEYP